MKVIFELVAQDTNVATELQKQRDLLRALNKEYKNTTEAADQKRLVTEIAKTKVAISDLTKEQRKLNQEFKQTQVPTDSLAGMRLELSRLKNQISELSAAERKSEFGKALILQTDRLNSKVQEIEQSFGVFSRNVGNYKSAFSDIGDLLTGGLVTGGAVVAVQKLIDVIKIGVESAVEYEKALSELSALTGATGSDLSALEDVGKGLQNIDINGQRVVTTGTEVLNALKLVGGAQPELLKDVDALGEVTKQAIILSKASGDGLEPSVNALTTVLGQFDLQASESAKVINELAAGAKEGSSEIPQTTEALQKFGTIANVVNATTSESVALIELLADRQLKGAEAGTQLRNILAKLASADILPDDAQKAFQRLGIDVNILKDATLPLEVRLRELGKAQGDVSALTKAFGDQNLQAATIITDGIPRYVELTEKIKGTSEAYKQAAINSDNATTSFQNLKNSALNELQEGFDPILPILKGVSDGLTSLFSKVDIGSGTFKQLAGNMGIFVDILKAFNVLQEGQSKKEEYYKETREASFKLLFSPPEGGDKMKPFLENQAKAAKTLSDALNEAGTNENTIGGLQKKLSGLKDSFEKTEIGTPQFRKLQREIRATELQIEKFTKKVNGDTDTPAAGSIEALRKRVGDLKNELESAKPDQIPRIFGNLSKAEADLKKVEDQVERLRNKAKIEGDKNASGTNVTDPLTGVPVPDLLNQVEQSTDDLANARLKKIKEFNEEVAKDDEKLRKERTEAELKEAEKVKRGKELIRAAEFDAALSVVNALADSQRQKIDEEQNQKLSALDAEYAKKKEAAQGNAAALAKIDKEYEAKKAAIEKQAAEERKRVAIIESIIAGALAVVKALPNVPLAIATGIAAATQTAIIATKKFAFGGFTGKGGRHDETGERTGPVVQLHEGEYVAPRAQVEQNPALFRWLDRTRPRRGASTGFGFAAGGFNTAPGITFSTAQSQQAQAISLTATAEISPDSADLIAEKVAKQVYGAVASGLNDADRTNERKAALTEFTNV